MDEMKPKTFPESMEAFRAIIVEHLSGLNYYQINLILKRTKEIADAKLIQSDGDKGIALFFSNEDLTSKIKS